MSRVSSRSCSLFLVESAATNAGTKLKQGLRRAAATGRKNSSHSSRLLRAGRKSVAMSLAESPLGTTESGWSAPEACFGVSGGDCEEQALDVEGEIPSWLSGDFIRNGPGGWDGGNRPMRHMFDGYAMLVKVSFKDGKVSSKQKYIKSKAYKYYAKNGKMLYDEFGTGKEEDTPANRVRKLWDTTLGTLGLTDRPITDNAVVNVMSEKDGTLVAMTESVPGTYLLNQDTLDTLKQYTYKGVYGDGTDPIPSSDLTTAHPFIDPHTDEVINVESVIGFPTVSRTVWSRKLGSNKRRPLATFPGRDASTPALELVQGKKDNLSFSPPAYYHAFSTSKKHVMIHELPAFFDMESLLFGDKEKAKYVAFMEKPELGTVLYLVDRNARDCNQKPQMFYAPSFFCFHVVNSFDSEDGKCFMTDLLTYKDPQVVNDLLLDHLRADPTAQEDKLEKFSRTTLTRITLDKDNGTCTMSTLSELNGIGNFLELPTINAAYAMDECYKYVYGICVGKTPSRLANGLGKVNVETGDIEGVWYEPGHIPTEIQFIARPDAKAQDDGVLVSLVTAPAGKRSFCLVLDASDFSVLAKAYFPEKHRLPYGFHGTFIESSG